MVDVVFEGLFPCVATGIHEFQATAGVLETDARTTAIGIVFGIVGVVAGEDELIAFLRQTDIDLRGSATADAMLEGVLNERDKQ